MVPLAVVMSVEWNVIISARVSDVWVAQQIGILLILPFGGIYVAGELNTAQQHHHPPHHRWHSFGG
jgi:hypothetical protein